MEEREKILREALAGEIERALIRLFTGIPEHKLLESVYRQAEKIQDFELFEEFKRWVESSEFGRAITDWLKRENFQILADEFLEVFKENVEMIETFAPEGLLKTFELTRKFILRTLRVDFHDSVEYPPALRTGDRDLFATAAIIDALPKSVLDAEALRIIDVALKLMDVLPDALSEMKTVYFYFFKEEDAIYGATRETLAQNADAISYDLVEGLAEKLASLASKLEEDKKSIEIEIGKLHATFPSPTLIEHLKSMKKRTEGLIGEARRLQEEVLKRKGEVVSLVRSLFEREPAISAITECEMVRMKENVVWGMMPLLKYVFGSAVAEFLMPLAVSYLGGSDDLIYELGEKEKLMLSYDTIERLRKDFRRKLSRRVSKEALRELLGD